MQPIPPFVVPSAASTVVFVVIVLGLVALLVLGVYRANASNREKWALRTAVGMVFWLALTGLASGSGALEADLPVPPPMLFLAASMLVPIGMALFAFRGPVGGWNWNRVAGGLPGLPHSVGGDPACLDVGR